MYDHLLLNDGSDFLVDVVAVSAILNDINSSVGNSYFCGYIRPIPPIIDFGKWGLPYGLCVDVYYQDAWWEGVIFYHEDGSEERRVFFPDLGDELKVGIETLRTTQDWDEATGNWKRHGTWSFLELIDQYEQEYYLAVSLKQIWYEVRAKKGFMRIGEWTFAMNDLWKESVMEVIGENLNVTLKEMLQVLEIPSRVAMELAEVHVDINENSLFNLANFDAIVAARDSVKCDIIVSNDSDKENAFDSHGSVMEELPKYNGSDTKFPDTVPSFAIIHLAQEESQMNDESIVKTLNSLGLSYHDEAFSVLPKALSMLLSNAEGFSGASSITHQQLPIIKHKNVDKQLKCTIHGSSYNWQPLSPTVLLDAALCPSAIPKYLLLGRKKPAGALIKDVRKHLLYFGWRVECKQDKTILRYASLDGKYFYSLRQVCKHLVEPFTEIPSSIYQNGMRVMHESCDEISSPQAFEQIEKSSSPQLCFQTALHGSDVVFEKSKIFPKAIIDYNNLNKLNNNRVKNVPEMRSKARRHLLTLGWHLLVRKKERNRRWYYTSPLERTYSSLIAACKVYIDEKGVYGISKSTCRPVESRYLIKKTEGQSDRNKFCSPPSDLCVQECLMSRRNGIMMRSGRHPLLRVSFEKKKLESSPIIFRV